MQLLYINTIGTAAIRTLGPGHGIFNYIFFTEYVVFRLKCH